MDTNKLANTTDFESVASAVYEAIDSQLEPEEDDDDVNDEEMEHYSKSPGNYSEQEMRLLADHHNDDDEENPEESTTHQSKEEEEQSSMSVNCQMDDESSPYVLDKRVAPLIVQDDSGLIKKIKISTAKNLVQRFTQNMATAPAVTPPKTEKITIKGLQQHSPSQQQPRSSTPLSREYLALQKTQNDSKIIKKFVTDARIEKTRKGKAKEQNSGSTPTTPTGSNNNSTTTVITSSDHSYTSRRRSNNNSLISPEKEYVESGGGPHTSISQQLSKRHRHGRFAPLKDADIVDTTPTLQSQRSRSKSMHNHSDDDHSNSSSSHHMLKKWPSEERVAATKRTNMRSENSDFVQKQKEFLQHVINSTQDTPQRTLFRARSTGTESDTSNQTKSRRPRERSSKRLAADFEQNICDNEDVLTKRTRSRTRSRSVGNTSGVESTTAESENQTKRYKSKRLKDDTTTDEGDSKLMLSQSIVMECSTTTDDHGEGGESSLNNSHNSTLAANTSTDVTTTTTATTRSTSTENLDSLQSLKKVWQPPPKPGSDSFCWKCHEANVNIACSKCVRSFHTECAKDKLDSAWFCPECTTVENILNSTKKSRRNELSVDLLSQLLAFALKRMRFAKGNYSFVMPYEDENIYKKIIVNPVHFGTLQEKIDSKEYRCAEEFVNDTKWMLHNAYILSSGNNTKTVLGTKGILKICRQEVNEIETCAECYLNANTRTDWFVDVCSQPHLLLWAKLKGFPYWPAKAMNFGQNSLVNVRFFGQHDRAFVSVKECFLYSERDPNIQTGKRAARELADCMKEVEEHIERIKSKVGGFKYAPFKTPYDPTDEMAQLEAMMPGVQDFIKKQLVLTTKPSLQFKIYKTADNHLSIVQKASSTPDLSTPPHQQQLQQEFTADELPTSAKKKKCFSANEEAKKPEEMSPIVSAAKYEVISKVTSDDSNSSKLSTVILKRKAVHIRGGDDTKKSPQDEENPHSELHLPKMQRIEESGGGGVVVEESKRKVEIVGNERVKDKYGKQELRIPAITIKTNCTPKDILSLGNEIQKSAKEESEPQHLEKDKTALAITPKEFSTSTTPSSTTTITTPTATQKVVENLVKNKQGVTIKKIPKEAPATPTTNVVIANAAAGSDSLTLLTTSPSNPNISQTSLRSFEANKAKETANTSTKQSAEKPLERLAKGKLDEDKHLDDQHVTSILKGLVPFVEIKREILSDNEERDEGEVCPKTATEELGKPETAVKPNSSSVTPNTRSHMKECQSLITSNSTSNSNNNPTQKEVDPPSPPPAALITQVKEEIFSDEDENTGPSKETSKQINSSASCSIVKPSNEVRVVGDTTIQKLSSRNATQLLGNVNAPSKRKGVPYGPLPASAFPRVFIETLSSDILGTQPRAKKSFPQCSPSSHEKLRTSPDNANGSLLSAATSGSQDANKRTMSKNTMVTIPVDRNNCNSAIITNVPVPPLTAVSKTMPSSNLYNSMARSSAAVTVTVSGTSASGLSNPLVMSTKTSTVASYLSSAPSCASPAITRNSPITVATSILPSYTATATSIAASTSTSTLSSVSSSATTTTTTTATSAATAINPTQNSYVNPLVLSTPPPLAGLSGINLNTNTLLNGGSGCVITPTPPTPTTEAISTTTTTTTISTTESQNQQQQHPQQPPPTQQQHVPNEALTSAISDSLCRSIPKLLARPKGGLLQSSEERPIFPSQAGPVCNRLFHNSFKVADVLITVIEDTIGELAQGDEASLQAKLTLVTMELERSKLAQEEMRKNMEIEKNRLMKSMENEKNRLVSETRKQCQQEWKQREIELKRAIDETKRKQWCAQCGREANFYCCWNTSYCDYPCQQLHWRWHAANCAQTRTSTQETLATGGAVSTSNVQTATAMQEQRHHITTKSSNQNNSSSLITPANVNIKSSTALKKEKTFAKNASSSNSMLSASSSSMTAAPSSRSNNSAEVLKLPTNTYIRPVNSSMGQQTLRCNTTYSIPVQRFNAPLPITTPANSANGPHTYTIVQQGNSSWVMSTSGNANASNNATVAAPIVSVPQIGQHRSGSVMTANKSSKTQIRHH